MGHFNHTILLASHKYSSLLGGGTLIHQTPWCLLCLPCAAFICFGTADLWTVSRHAAIFPSDSIEKGKQINYSSLGAVFIYPARNGVGFVPNAISFWKKLLCHCSQFFLPYKGMVLNTYIARAPHCANKTSLKKTFSHKVLELCMPWGRRFSALILHIFCIILHF